MPDRIWIQFADNGNIRKWQREPFDGGVAYLSTVTPAEVGGLPGGLDATDMDMIRRGDMLGPVLGARVASLIQSQAARIADRDELIAAFVRANDEGPGLIDCIDNHGERYTSAGLDVAIRTARALTGGQEE